MSAPPPDKKPSAGPDTPPSEALLTGNWPKPRFHFSDPAFRAWFRRQRERLRAERERRRSYAAVGVDLDKVRREAERREAMNRLARRGEANWRKL